MPPPDARPLSAEARRLLALNAALVKRLPEVMAGFTATHETTTIRHGRFGPDLGSDAADGVQEMPADAGELPALLDGPGYERFERPAETPGEIRVWVLMEALETDAPASVEFVFAGERLARASMNVTLPGLAQLAMSAPPTAEMTFGLVDGVPLVVETRSRMRSRGIGRFRIDVEIVTAVHYTPRV